MLLPVVEASAVAMVRALAVVDEDPSLSAVAVRSVLASHEAALFPALPACVRRSDTPDQAVVEAPELDPVAALVVRVMPETEAKLSRANEARRTSPAVAVAEALPLDAATLCRASRLALEAVDVPAATPTVQHVVCVSHAHAPLPAETPTP